jgi:hypothetical protein
MNLMARRGVSSAEGGEACSSIVVSRCLDSWCSVGEVRSQAPSSGTDAATIASADEHLSPESGACCFGMVS